MESKKQFCQCFPGYGYRHIQDCQLDDKAESGGSEDKLPIDALRTQEFTHLQHDVYLDHAAATMYAKSQIDDFSSALLWPEAPSALGGGLLGNPHSLSSVSNSTSQRILQQKQAILTFFNTSIDEYGVVFTSGATQALEIVGQSFPWRPGQSEFTHTMDCHTSVLGIRALAQERNVTTRCLSMTELNELTASLAQPTSNATSNNPGHKQLSAVASHPGHEFPHQAHEADQVEDVEEDSPNAWNLFAFPAECNFSGVQHPLELVRAVQQGILTHCKCFRSSCDRCGPAKPKWLVLLDAAAFVPTNALDLARFPADFVTVSFYKIFGFPTGVGALLVRKPVLEKLRKRYYGGGTVQTILATSNLAVKRGHRSPFTCTSNGVHGPTQKLVQRDRHDELLASFEDGTCNFLSIVALQSGLALCQRLTMAAIHAHTSSLTRWLYEQLVARRHWNGQAVCEVYGNHHLHQRPCVSSPCDSHGAAQGSIVACNFRHFDGSYVGFTQVNQLASLHNIHLRTGCFCNPGACQWYLGLDEDKLRHQRRSGHVCGDEIDLIDGVPTGAVRVSIGYMTTFEEIQAFMQLVDKYLVTGVGGAWTPTTTPTRSPVRGGTGMRLAKVTLFPIKSCAGMHVDKWPIGPRGLLFDREWAIVDVATSKALCQKDIPQMCRIRPVLDLAQHQLTLHFESPKRLCSSCVVSLQGSRKDDHHVEPLKVCTTLCCCDKVQQQHVDDWLSGILGRPCALVRVSASHSRDAYQDKPSRADPTTSQQLNQAPVKIGFANQAQYLVISRTSIQDLNDLLQQKRPDLRVDEDVFRANFIIEGADAAFDEDRWRSLQILPVTHGPEHPDEQPRAKLQFDVTGACSRCRMININQETGEFTGELLQLLASFRRERGRILFGQFLALAGSDSATKSCSIAIGDVVQVTRVDPSTTAASKAS